MPSSLKSSNHLAATENVPRSEPPTPEERAADSPKGRSALRVLYVTVRTDAPYRYRCMHGCLQLRAEGVVADVAFLDRATEQLVKNYSVVVLFRLPWNESVEAVVRSARKLNIKVVFEIDDLIFDESAIPQLHFWETLHPGDKKQYLILARGLRKTFEESDFFIGATEQLRQAAAARGKQAASHPNLLHPTLLRMSAPARFARSLRRTPPIISYMSGSSTHDVDFLKIAPVIRRVMDERPDVRLLVCGFVDLSDFFAADDPRLIRFPYLDWKVLPWVQSLARVNLAPLASIDQFTSSKSALKFFEAAVIGVPTIATPSEEMKRSIRHDENGFLAANNAEWYQCISKALNAETSREIGAAALRAAKAEHSFAAHRGELRRIFERIADPRAKPCSARPKPTALLPEVVDPKLAATPSLLRKQSVDRLRAIVGILRRAGRPESLGQRESLAGYYQTLHFSAIDTVRPETLSTNIRAHDIPPPDVKTITDQRRTAWEIAWQVERMPGEACFRSTGCDPCFLGPQMKLPAAQYRFLLLTMTAKCDAPASTAQLFWLSDRSAEYHEERSCSFPVLCDNEEHTYLVDLHRLLFVGSSAAPWLSAGTVRRLRFDPLRHPGTFSVGVIRLLGAELGLDGQLWQQLGLRPLREELAARYLRGEGIVNGGRAESIPLPKTVELKSRSGYTPESLDFCLLDSDAALASALSALRRGGVIELVLRSPESEPAAPLLPLAGVKILEQHSIKYDTERETLVVLKKV